MIKFFRKIRQNLLLEGKNGKYLKYAIGEIVLVVIGILIALSINNWNTDRINNNRVKQYAKSLVQDLENDIKMINVSQFQAKKSFKRIDSLKKKLMAYESYSYHLDEDFDQDMTNAHKAEEIISEIMDLNNPYFSQMTVLENERFNDPNLDLFKTVEYQSAKKEDRVLQLNNEKDMRKFINVFIRIQDSYRIRAFLEMDEIKENAKEIIQLLKNEYSQN